MNEELKEQLSDVFRNIENDLGTTGLSLLILESMTEAAEGFKGDLEHFYHQFKELLMMVKSTKPRIAIVISYFCEIWDEVASRKDVIKNMEDLKTTLRDVSELMLKENENDSLKIVRNAVQHINDGDTILIHSHSRMVLRTIAAAHQAKKKFRVILAEQEEEKTMDMIHFLQDNHIHFFSIPEFMLSHIENEVTKVFLGSLTLNNEHNFVTDAGTNSVVSEFHHAKIPIYMLISTRKFALWESTTKQHTYKVSQKRKEKQPGKELTYNRIKFSHDRIPIDLLDHIVTEDGTYTPKQIVKLFSQRYEERQDLRKRHFHQDHHQ